MRRHVYHLVACLAFSLVLATGARSAHARGAGGGSIGIGVVLGQPTAFTLEAYLGGHTALDFDAGFVDFDNQSDFYFSLDYIVLPVDLARGGSVSVPLYLGVGGAVIALNDPASDILVGVRVPFGLQLNFRSAPLQIFFELAIKVLIVDPIDTRRLDLDGGVGFRIFF
jgi:hypothetical protein